MVNIHLLSLSISDMETIGKNPTQAVLNTRMFVLPVIFLIKLLFCFCDAEHDYIQLTGKLHFSFCMFAVCIVFSSEFLENCDALGNHLRIRIPQVEQLFPFTFRSISFRRTVTRMTCFGVRMSILT